MRNTGNILCPRRTRILLITLGIGFLALALIVFPEPATASSAPVSSQSLDNAGCLTCHGQPGFTLPLPSGEIFLLTIDKDHFAASVHNNLSCTDCHANITSFPHPNYKAQSLREVSLQLYTVCQKCHAEQYNLTLDSVHQKALAGGNNNAAICTDCHNPHTQTPIKGENGQVLPDVRLQIPQKCARCHNAIYE